MGADGAQGAQGIQGEKGDRGKGFVPRGTWIPNTSYINSNDTIDVVKYNADAYYCKISHSRNLPPDIDTQYWGVLVEGGVSGEIFFGDGVTGTSETPLIFPNSGVADASIGDVYWNMSNGVDRGNMYNCTVAGNANVAKWAFAGNISTVETKLDDTTTAINYTIEANTEKTFNASGIASVALTIPASSYQGFISEVDLFIGNVAPTFSITNNSGKPLKLMRYGIVFDEYAFSANTEVNLLFRDNGVSIVCAILEL